MDRGYDGQQFEPNMLGEKLPPLSKMCKYNQKSVLRVHVSKKGIDGLLKYNDSILTKPKKARHNKQGFGLIAWFIHPDLLEKSDYVKKSHDFIESISQKGESLRYGKYRSKKKLQKLKKINSFSNLFTRDSTKMSIGEIVNKSGVKYLASPFNYETENSSSLRSL